MGVGRFLISTMTKMTHRGIVVQDCTKLLKSDSQEIYQALCKGQWPSRCQGTAAWLSHHASLDRLVFLVSVGSFLRERSDPVSEKAFVFDGNWWSGKY